MTTENETREFNEQFIEKFAEGKIPYQYWDGKTIQASLKDIMVVLKRLGYCLIPELTLIDDEEINKAKCLYSSDMSVDELWLIALRAVAQAQLSHTKKQLGIEK